MKVWQALQEVGEALRQEGEKKRAAVFENGEVPSGEEVAPELYIEADGVMIRLQRAKERRGEIKHIVAYEGKEEVSRGRFILKNKLVISSLREGEEAWEESYTAIGGKWDLSQTNKFYIGGDGAEWPKQGVEYFPGAEYRLDPYHLSKHLTEALWHDEENFRKVGLGISQGNWEETQRVLVAPHLQFYLRRFLANSRFIQMVLRQGLKLEELKDYCLSRLKLAVLNEDIFTPAALDAIYAATHGLPRLVNNLVTTCMLCACAKKQRTIDEEIVYQAQKELEI